MGRILAIDYGTKRLGVALSDPLGLIAQGLPTLNNQGFRQTLEKLQEIIEGNDIEQLVVGMPLTMKGEAGEASRMVNEFIDKVREKFSLRVSTWDERLTSVIANRTVRALGKSPSRNKAHIDRIAATLILQSYLDSRNKNG